ncbi:MAG: SDH family Clp fold serine proteinase [Candidatus Heimdallarchaeaceae archaeon]
MSRENRVKLIEEIEKLRNSRVIAYVTGDRKNYPPLSQISDDVLPLFKEILDDIRRSERIDLFLYSRGGATEVPWKVVSLIREYCDHFGVLIPFRAHSAATMIALGADEIVCGPAAELGPIDPSLTTLFNPKDPRGNPIPISVEAVRAFLDFASEYESQKQPQKAFELLSNVANPLAIGEVYRQHNYIRMVAMKLLKLNKNPPDDATCENIIKKLVEETYFHGHAIKKEEAKEIGLNVIDADPELEKAMWELLKEYSREMALNEPFEPLKILRNENFQQVENENACGLLESSTISYVKTAKVLIQPIRQMPSSISFNLPLVLPPNITEIIETNPNLRDIINELYQGLVARIREQVIQELNRQAPIVDVDLRRIEVKWSKL